MALLSKEQLENASADSDSLAEFVNNDETFTVRTRLGQIYPSIKKFLKGITDTANVVLGSIGYAVPVNYASGINLTQPNQTVSYNGAVYAPISSYLPFTTSGTLETDKFRVIQSVSANQFSGPNGSSLVGFIQSTGNSVARTVQDKARDFFSVKDTGAVLNGTANENAAMLAAAIAGTVYIPPGNYANVNIPAFSYTTSWVYEGKASIPVYGSGGPESGQMARRAQFDRIAGNHQDVASHSQAIVTRPVGSGKNGPGSADFGLTVSMVKENWPLSTATGEIDGLNIVVRNSSAAGGTDYKGDCAGILLNVGVTGNGFAAVIEGQVSELATTGAIVSQLGVQVGVIDAVTKESYGYFVRPNVGNGTAAFHAASSINAKWNYLFRGTVPQNNAERAAFNITGDGQLELFEVNGNQSKRTIRNRGNFLSFLNNSLNVETHLFSDGGDTITVGLMKIGYDQAYFVGDTPVVRQRVTGFNSMVGTANKSTNFDTSTITIQQLAARVKALQDALAAHGLIGV